MNEEEELLLLKLLDQELAVDMSKRERSHAERLLAHSSAAREFYNAQEKLQSELANYRIDVVDEHTLENSESEAFADRVLARIAQEERAEFFLGKRRSMEPNAEESSRFNLVDWLRHGTFGLLGGAVAAVLMLSLAPDMTGPQGSVLGGAPDVEQRLAFKESKQESLVSTVNVGSGDVEADVDFASGEYRRPRIIENEYPTTLEVDWMRSAGRVRVVPDAQQDSTIIWIRRTPQQRRARQSSARHNSTEVEGSSVRVVRPNSFNQRLFKESFEGEALGR